MSAERRGLVHTGKWSRGHGWTTRGPAVADQSCGALAGVGEPIVNCPGRIHDTRQQ